MEKMYRGVIFPNFTGSFEHKFEKPVTTSAMVVIKGKKSMMVELEEAPV